MGVSSEGSFIKEFERKWAAYCGVEHGISVANGTCALQVAVRALALEPGSEIILPSFTIISCIIAIIEAECIPFLVDAELDSWNMNLDQAEARITPRTRAIMSVHMFGHPVEMRRLIPLARKYDLRVIEDAAEGAWRGG